MREGETVKELNSQKVMRNRITFQCEVEMNEQERIRYPKEV